VGYVREGSAGCEKVSERKQRRLRNHGPLPARRLQWISKPALLPLLTFSHLASLLVRIHPPSHPLSVPLLLSQHRSPALLLPLLPLLPHLPPAPLHHSSCPFPISKPHHSSCPLSVHLFQAHTASMPTYFSLVLPFSYVSAILCLSWKGFLVWQFFEVGLLQGCEPSITYNV